MDICEPHIKYLFLYCCIYSALHSNGSYPIVTCVFFVAEMCLPSCPAACIHVTRSTELLYCCIAVHYFLMLNLMHLIVNYLAWRLLVLQCNLYSVSCRIPYCVAQNAVCCFFFSHSVGWNWVHSARRPLNGLLCPLRVIVVVENLVE
jgi:hypothetical protein